MPRDKFSKISPQDQQKKQTDEPTKPAEIAGLNLEELKQADAQYRAGQEEAARRTSEEREKDMRLLELAGQVEKLQEFKSTLTKGSPAVEIIEKRIAELLTENPELPGLLSRREEERRAWEERERERTKVETKQLEDKTKREIKEREEKEYSEFAARINNGKTFGDFGYCLTQGAKLGFLRRLNEAELEEIIREKLGYQTLRYRDEAYVPASFLLPSERKKGRVPSGGREAELKREREKGIFQLLTKLREKAAKSKGEMEKSERARREFIKKLKEGQTAESLEGFFASQPTSENPARFVLDAKTTKEIRGKFGQLRKIPYEGVLVLEMVPTKKGGRTLNISVPKEAGNLSELLGENPAKGTNPDLSGAPQKIREIIQTALTAEKQQKEKAKEPKI
ncbi:MAG: hypothetical protein AB1465_04945 [Patescibacteria group bacterium]